MGKKVKDQSMGKVKGKRSKKLKGKHRLDKYYRLAKEHGYRSRASWKLVQLDSKFRFLRSARSVLDLCAAPGGWMQVTVERVPVGSLVIGVDLDPILPIRGAVSLQEDITGSKCRASVKRIMAENGCRAFDLVLHDGSPNIGGAWTKEATSQNALVIDSLKLATPLLAPKGNFVTKVFRSQDYTAVLYCLRQLFEKVEVYKPPASRPTSAETYILGLKYRAPAKIDPRLLDVKHLFQGVKEPPKVVDVLRGTKQKRHRDGYEDGDTTLRKVCAASKFIWSESPLDILGTVTSITFKDAACLPIKEHALTTEEVKALCDDLRVLGKQDFKYLLKWRMHLRKALAPEKVTEVTPIVESESKEVVESESKEEDEDVKVLNEMEELTNAMERKKKRAKKILAKRRTKEKSREALGINTDAIDDGYTDLELFDLSSIKGKQDLVAVDNSEFDDAGDSKNSESEESHDESGNTFSDVDSEEDRRRYEDKMEELFDELHQRFVAKKDGSTKQRKRQKQAYSKDDDFEDEDEIQVHSDEDSDIEIADCEANPLIALHPESASTQEEIAIKWFDQDEFMDEDEHELMGKDEMSMERPYVARMKKVDSTEEPYSEKKCLSSSKTVDDGFEIVPAPLTDSSDSSSDDESDEDDIATKAEILACANKLVNKKQRENIVDDAYNKYMFDDKVMTPKWFADDEQKHYKPNKPVTKEEINAMKAQFKAINARPAKKVAQVLVRKKRDAQRRIIQIRKKANIISNQEEYSERSKSKMIEQLYMKAQPKKPEREYVVAKKGVHVKPTKGKVLVDPRMKKDSRKHGMNKQGKGGKQMKSSGKGKRKKPQKG